MVRIAPEALPYPPILPLADVPEFDDGLLTYAIKSYVPRGKSIVVKRENGELAVRVADFEGHVIDVTKEPSARTIVNGAVTICVHARIVMSQWYFVEDSEGFLLVDIRKNPDVFVGPGLLRDLCGKTFRTQEVVKIGQLKDFKKDLKGDLIMKPSKYRSIMRNDALQPLYGHIKL
ncbi:MAG: hypothetical protein Q8K86_08945 [Candidatus Nanopelagicaceae bacterium]|nr:hypothetical protein [Candidatus Nanopelagicaceae bacterium]